MDIDKKFIFTGFNPCTGRTITQDNAFVFKASDDAAVKTLEFYHDECVLLGCDEAQLDGIRGLIDRVKKWRLDNADQCKRADTNACEAKITGKENTQ